MSIIILVIILEGMNDHVFECFLRKLVMKEEGEEGEKRSLIHSSAEHDSGVVIGELRGFQSVTNRLIEDGVGIYGNARRKRDRTFFISVPKYLSRGENTWKLA